MLIASTVVFREATLGGYSMERVFLTREEDLGARGVGSPTINHNSSQDGDDIAYYHMQHSAAYLYREGLRVLAQCPRRSKFFPFFEHLP